MTQVTVGPKYQIVIPKEIRKKLKGFIPGAKVAVSLKDETTITVTANPKNWTERSRGIAKKAWQDIDTTKYLEDLRNEWKSKK